MALDKQKIALPIVDGLDTKGDDKTILPTRFLELENVDFTNPGSMKKRNGYTALSNSTISGDKITTGSALTALKDELLQYSNNRLYSFSEGEQAWEDKGEVRFCSAFSEQVSADNSILKNPSSYSYGGISCYAYEKQVANISHDPSLGPDIYDVQNIVEIVIVDDKSKAIVAKHVIDGSHMPGVSPIPGVSRINAPKVGFIGSKFVVFYYVSRAQNGSYTSVSTTGLSYSSVDFLNPKVLTNQITAASIAASTSTVMPATTNRTAKFKYDVVSFNSRCFFAYTDADAPDVLIRYLGSDLVLSAPQSTGYLATGTAVHNISLNKQDQYLRAFISPISGGNAAPAYYKAKAYLYSFNLNAQIHPPIDIPAPIPASAPGNAGKDFFSGFFGVYTISGYQDPNDSTRTFFVWQAKDLTVDAGFLMSATIDSNGTIANLVNPIFAGAELQSKIASYNGYPYFLVSKAVNSSQVSTVLNSSITSAEPGYAGTLDTINKPVRTLFLIKALAANSEISAKFETDTAVFVDPRYMSGLPNVTVDDTGFRSPVASINGLQPVNATSLLAPAVIKVLKSDFSQSLNYFDETQGESLYISGGLLKQYDGNKVVEQGFLDTPEPLKDIAATGAPNTAADTGDFYATTTGGLSANKKYFYVVVYKWTDRTGKVHYSAPSRAVDTTTPALAKGTEYRVNLTFTPLYFTNKENVEIEIYRTQGNGTIYYKVSHLVSGGSNSDYLSGSYKNNKLLQSISVVDNVADVELAFAEPLYTTGGVLENDSPEASNFIASYKSRLILLLSDGYTLQYSKVTGIGDPVRFNAAFKIPLDNFGGKATAAIAMDDHLIIFKERAIFAMTGEGPNELGQQDDFRTPYLITSDAGCIDPNSLVNNPNGIMFKSAKGIYMLKRNFTLQYIGDSVEGFNDEAINSATLHPSLNQIRLITAAGRALVYDYYCNRWSTYTNMFGLDSIAFGGLFYYIKADGLVMKETIGAYVDNGQYIQMRIKSAWIQIAGLQGFERFYKMMLLGTYLSAHKLKVAIAYNFNTFYQQSVIFDTGTLLATPSYGSGDYGSGPNFGGVFPLYQFEIRPKIQKCQSFQFELMDFKTDTDGAAFSLSHVSAEIGVKKGGVPKSNARTFGTK